MALCPGADANSGQALSKMAEFENRSGAYISYVSTGSAEHRHLQTGLTRIQNGFQVGAWVSFR